LVGALVATVVFFKEREKDVGVTAKGFEMRGERRGFLPSPDF
jgi:hypothetical protein